MYTTIFQKLILDHLNVWFEKLYQLEYNYQMLEWLASVSGVLVQQSLLFTKPCHRYKSLII